MLPSRNWIPSGPETLTTLLPLAATAVAHISVLNNPFRWDEFVHLFMFVNNGLSALVAPLYHGHSLLTSNLVYVPMYELFGVNPAPYYLLALLTHLLNVFLLQRTLILFTGRPRLAAMVATLWGISPLTRISIGWFAVYGHILVTTFGLLILHDMARLYSRHGEISFWHVFRWSVLLFAATTSFGIGPGLSLGFAGAAALLLPATPRRARVAIVLGLLVFAVPIFFLMGPTLLGEPRSRILMQQLVWKLASGPDTTLARVAPLGLHHLFDLVSYATASFFLGPLIALRVELPTGPAYVASGPMQGVSGDVALGISRALLVALALVAYWVLRRAPADHRRLVLGLALLLSCAYTPVALSSLLGSLLGAAVHREDWLLRGRLHYLGPMLVAMITCIVAAARPAGAGWTPRPRTLAIAGVAVALWIFWCAQTAARLERSLPVTLQPQDLVIEKLHELVAKEPVGADVYIRNRVFLKREALALPIFPGWAGLFMLSFPENRLDGRHVYFVGWRPRVLNYARNHPETRIAQLIVRHKPDGPLSTSSTGCIDRFVAKSLHDSSPRRWAASRCATPESVPHSEESCPSAWPGAAEL